MTHFTGAFSFVLPRSRRTLPTVKKILKKLLTKDVERGNLLIVTDEDERKIKKSLAIWLGI